MPYIKKKDRKLYDERLDNLCFALEEQSYVGGHVTYVLFKLLARWFFHSPSYNSIMNIRGCLAGTLSELDRRYFFPYEDKKIRKNGDIEASLKIPQTGRLQYNVCPCCVDELRGD